jgi:hypothetical protein
MNPLRFLALSRPANKRHDGFPTATLATVGSAALPGSPSGRNSAVARPVAMAGGALYRFRCPSAARDKVRGDACHCHPTRIAGSTPSAPKRRDGGRHSTSMDDTSVRRLDSPILTE